MFLRADTLAEARFKLNEEIVEYVNAATIGHDAKFFEQLIPRKAPWSAWIKYYLILTKYFFYRIAIMWNQYPNLNSKVEFFNERRLILKHNVIKTCVTSH